MKKINKKSNLKSKLGILSIAALMIVLGAIMAVAPAANSAYAIDRNTTFEDVTLLEELRETPAELIATWDSYDSRVYNIVTPVRDQGDTNLCWSYASTAAMEINILRQGLYGADVSELELDPAELSRAIQGKWDDPLDIADKPYDRGNGIVDQTGNQKPNNRVNADMEGGIGYVAKFAPRWQGIYDKSAEKPFTPEETYSKYKVKSVAQCDNDVDRIKLLVATYGSATFTFGSTRLNWNTNFYYTDAPKDHAGLIVGWDDSIPASNFPTGPNGGKAKNNGAWIVKNSWGASYHTEGFYYLSYDSVIYEIFAFEMLAEDEYDWAYNYSGVVPQGGAGFAVLAQFDYADGGTNDIGDHAYAATFTAQKGTDEKKEYLKSVAVGVAGPDGGLIENVTIDVEVYNNITGSLSQDPINGELVSKTSFLAPTSGFYDIELNDIVELTNGQKFTIYVKLSDGFMIMTRSDAASEGNVYMNFMQTTKSDGSSYWKTLQGMPYINGCLFINARTKVEELDTRICIADFDLTLDRTEFGADGKANLPNVTLTDNDGNVVDPSNYIVTYVNTRKQGYASVFVKGIGNYRGRIGTTYEIVPPVEVYSEEVQIQIESGYYQGDVLPVAPDVTVIYTVEFVEFERDFDYEVTYEVNYFDAPNGDVIGTGTATIKFLGKYFGSVSVTFTVYKGTLSVFPTDITVGDDKTYLRDVTPFEDWLWDTPDKILLVGENTVTMTHREADRYTNGKTTITVTRAQLTKLINLFEYDLNDFDGTSDDFDKLCEIMAIINSLTAEEQAAFRDEDLAAFSEYKELVDNWNEIIADLDKILDAATKLANSPMVGLWAHLAM